VALGDLLNMQAGNPCLRHAVVCHVSLLSHPRAVRDFVFVKEIGTGNASTVW
jgi:hypothetical protein